MNKAEEIFQYYRKNQLDIGYMESIAKREGVSLRTCLLNNTKADFPQAHKKSITAAVNKLFSYYSL